MPTLRSLVLFVLVGALTGCSNQYLLSSKFVAKSQGGQAPETVETPFYQVEHSQFRTVAVRAPDDCLNQTAAQTTGSAISTTLIMRTTCGVEMAEIERKLAKAGYRVISWKVLEREVINKVSAIEGARALGAEVLFQINSLEQRKILIGKDALWERTFYETNKAGKATREHAFDDSTRAYFQKKFFDNFESTVEKDEELKRLAVTLDANAVFVKTGESIWYYRWTHTDPASLDYHKDFLIKCNSSNSECDVVQPARQNDAPTNMTVSGESKAVSVTEKAAERDQAIYAQLLSTVVDDLVRNFSKGGVAQNSPGPAR